MRSSLHAAVVPQPRGLQVSAVERQSVSCHFCVLFLLCLPLFDPSLISPASSPSPFSFHVVVICVAVEVFRTINLPLCHVSELASSSSSSAQPSDGRSSSSPLLSVALPLVSLAPPRCVNWGLMGSCGAVWRLQGWRPRREQL